MLLFAFGGLRSFGICAGSANTEQYDTSLYVMKSSVRLELLQTDVYFDVYSSVLVWLNTSTDSLLRIQWKQ